ncbi:MAG TPA: carbamoyltransferase C-terminal domain-containing protein, partial [Pyrinomonadaceae bacterium]|nr:carbamoyltransferase C-terminal domain-containing protein [Pyrinomonadaceae bacterium]
KSELARALAVAEKTITARIHRIEHHRAHLASAFFVSPFDRAALLSLDGFGDFVSTMWAIGEGNSIEVLGQVEYPHSLGIVYTATTQFLGFPHYGDEGKVMGLAPYGEPRFVDQFREIVRTERDGRFGLNLDYFRHASEGVDMTWDGGSPKIGRLFSDEYADTFGPPRLPDAPLTRRDRDVAASLQLRLEEVAFHVLNHLHEQTGLTELGLAGGVAYNSVMNGKILTNTRFRRVFIQPAAGDSGTAIGVCYQIWSEVAQAGSLRSQISNLRHSPYTGPEFSQDEIATDLRASSLDFETLKDRELVVRAARDIADGLVVGWFQGRMEFGPRALGNRSILADPRRIEMKDILNARIKKREPFRPFAPSILEEHIGDYFEQTHPSPAMLMVYEVKADRRKQIPAVTHVDGSGRLQSVTREANPRYYDLIEQFYQLAGVPVVLNTSFNENEPIVCTPGDAIKCFLKTRIDVLYLGNQMIRKSSEIAEHANT